MTDEELIKRLRAYAQIEHAAAAWGFAGEGEVMSRAADRIEALVKENTALGMYVRSSDEGFRQMARAERLEAALRLIADDAGAGTWQGNHARAALTEAQKGKS